MNRKWKMRFWTESHCHWDGTKKLMFCANHPDPCNQRTKIYLGSSVCFTPQQAWRNYCKKLRLLYKRYKRTMERIEELDRLSGGKVLG